MPDSQSCQVLIVGAGFSGMCMAIGLQRAGINDFILVEKADEVGGTWRENNYPGAECDVASVLYSYSFESNSSWEYKWAERDQIFDYQKRVANKYNLYEKTRFGMELSEATWDAAKATWQVSFSNGKTIDCHQIVTAVGQLNRPNIPDFEGMTDFQGACFHSAQWDQAVDLKNKRVAVIGNAASALQFIPELARQIEQLDIYQRSANWVMPKMDRPYKPWEQKLSAAIPAVNKLYRLKIWLRQELLFFRVMKANRLFSWLLSRVAQAHMEASITDPQLRAALTPDYPIGAKRVLLSDNYFETLARENVAVVTAPVKRFNKHGIECDDSTVKYDAIIFGTGFKTNPFLAPMVIRGEGGKLLSEHWRDGAQAYLGITTHGFPNLFMLYGPNTNLGHNSILLMIETQVKYIVQCLEEMARRNRDSIQVGQDVEESYNQKLQRELQAMAFSQVGDSWYFDQGKITNNWSGSTWGYRRRTRRPDFKHFNFS